jgi:ribosome-binding factor A
MEQGMERLTHAVAAVLRERVEFPRGCLVTVLDAKITRDSKHAKVVLSVLPERYKDNIIETLRTSEHDIKDGLAHELRMRRIPALHWAFDFTEAEAAEIEWTINELKAKGEI